MKDKSIGKRGGRRKRFEQTTHRRYKMASKYIKMFNFIRKYNIHQEIQNQTHNEISLNTNQNG